ncbi:neutral endopeptidase [Levilactobacillus senmaizukei DSM 21775 = NBRC 103853]|uniref:Neutral endopeptidase n=1 Tax=Levilactobacillus senmaizukei DSM 21775 = NBRC 103853 TaxID=1423803 RepID=A0A0R2DH60_9LACO|nr:M13-type metalloendopeptidase [Levilactobacillus senmaizukei]KRN03353.1 neutral endopeptidase [Levilactobacillus senmaizukei DSM 21775 = NBRC 103853]
MRLNHFTSDTAAGGATKDFPVNDQQLTQDLYDAVNGAWADQATIPGDHASTGGFMDLVDNIEKTLMSDFRDLLTGKLMPANDEMAAFKRLYAQANDFQQREATGTAPLKPYLDRITALTDLDDLNRHLVDFIKVGLPTPIDFGVEPDMKDTSNYALYLDAPNLFLPDKTYYEKGNQAAAQLMPIFTSTAEKLLGMLGYSTDDAHQIVADAKAFDAQIAPHVKSSEEAADYVKVYNPRDTSAVAKQVSHLDLTGTIQALLGDVPEQAILPQPIFFDATNDLITPANFELIKHWMMVKTVFDGTGALTEEFRQVGGTYRRALSGQKQARSKEKAAFYLATGTFSQVVGDYYGRKYFGEAAKADVRKMVLKMTHVYQQRLKANDWLSTATSEKAITKLQKLTIKVGYPDEIDPLYRKYRVDPDKSLFDNLQAISEVAIQNYYGHWGKPVDRERWDMSANTVNAYYSPSNNEIVFPAAILQAPFYSLDQSSSANYGGIGAVIAHEISHAFDNNGSQFDEFGNLNNWWTDADLEHFQGLAKAMINEFNGIEFAGQKVNGKLTVSENIADAGGLSCALEAAKSADDVDLRAFFINWANVWRMKATTEYMQLLLSIDVHAPAKLRANVQVKNLDDFYTTFNVQPDDAMYLAPADRVKIW